ncbi:MAG: Ferredoxin--NADP reductase [Alphaproteobacteria bacterium MarineAlpha5_Bin11]|nr:ferredoxin--NADP(+) reductase [Pelagibacteraceae bacterium]PPR42808.1 MAG: Ferredoxin--NADP reductase [Alphaproteobacteria bacterium MarineAlpha5_Bin11]PPR52027.1 MAG: Ferredoxin--NADP reductase [Alphaproteobacteria bacterium MarineAlpha5_Bin10]|tara:strand:+ start:141 stop:1157 length:1017 start_codon:yes stop_codon:yes gene_type:complete
MQIQKTDVVIIGAGPVGLFAVFELGLLNMNTHLIDNLDKIGGQCSELYPEKPIYDIPSRLKISAQELVDDLYNQCKAFNPTIHLKQQAEKLERNKNNEWIITTSTGEEIIAKCIVIAAGAGSFVPRKLPLKNIEKYENISVFYSVRDKKIFKNKNILIAGGGDSALDWAIELSNISNVSIVHRRKEFRAAPDSVKKILELEKNNKIKFYYGNIDSLSGQNGKLDKVTIIHENKKFDIESDYLLPFFGLKMELGPIANWNLKLKDNLIEVDTEKFETSIPSIFSIGDINWYPGKLKLILSGFHEAALMSRECFKYCYPDKKLVFRYTTSSKEIHKKLGV